MWNLQILYQGPLVYLRLAVFCTSKASALVTETFSHRSGTSSGSRDGLVSRLRSALASTDDGVPC